jgi:SpoVK/Ycf46/Vps4 family AAA+-type ATPase
MQAELHSGFIPGLQVSSDEAAAILSQPLNPFTADPTYELTPITDWNDPAELQHAWHTAEPLIAARRQATIEQGIPLTLDQLSRAFNLSPFEEQLLLLALAPELSHPIGRLYAYLQNDLNASRPSIHLALDWLQPNFASRSLARRAFDSDAPLFHNRLLHRHPAGAPLLDQQLFLPERLTRHLLGRPDLDPTLASFCQLEIGDWRSEIDQSPISNLQSPLFDFLCQHPPSPQFIYLHGPYGSGRSATVHQIAHALNRPLLTVNGRQLAQSGDQFLTHLGRIRRECRLTNAILYIQHATPFLTDLDPTNTPLDTLLDSAAESSDIIFLSGDAPWQPYAALNRHSFVTWAIPTPGEPERLDHWQQVSASHPLAPDVDLSELAGRFRFTPGQIRDAWQVAHNTARLRQPANPTVTTRDLYAGAYAQSVHHLQTMAELVPTVHSWDDIVLPTDTIAQLREITARARHLHQVYHHWGFNRKIATNRGLSALFTGPSGTGKTMAASIIARELGLELYRIDLSAVVSKYVGETEKNLGRVFDEAWRSNAVIFFDEADALFGKRSEVRDSHDRYANIEVNYLLQRMDSFEGIAILASNLAQNIDDAFQRRLQFMINFPFPEAGDRYHIWQRIWPAETPLAPDLDFRFLADRFKLNGGNIRNVVLQAAFLSATAGEPQVTMQHILAALLREIRKTGKLVSAADFGPYADLLDID